MLRSYSMTLPTGTKVVITIPGPSLIASANSLYRSNEDSGWKYEDCLAICSLSSINGEKVTDLSTSMSLDTKDHLALREIVVNLVAPTAQELQATIATIEQVYSADSVESVVDATPIPQ